MSILTEIRGDDDNIKVTFKDADGAVVDITGYTVFFTVKLREDLYDTDDTNAKISKKITVHSDPTNGETTIKLTSTDTAISSNAEYYYDIQLKSSTGDISSIDRGNFVITEDVTKRIS